MNKIVYAKLDRSKYKDTRSQKSKKLEYVTNRFRSSAIELLATNRYINEEDQFSELTQNMFNLYLNYNDQLSAWESSGASAEEWFLDTACQEQFTSASKKFLDKMINIQKKLELSY
jgi:hypothetical protein